MVESMYEAGKVYTKCGVLLEDLVPASAAQADLFAIPDPKAPTLLAAIDGINAKFGRNTIALAVQGFGTKSFDTKRALKSPSWTTKLSDIPVAR